MKARGGRWLLRIEDVDLCQGMAFIRQGKGDKDRYVPIPAKLSGQLRAWIADRREGWVFPSPLSSDRLCSRGIQRLMKRIATKANIAGANVPRKVTPHKLRHAYASRLLQTGADIMEVRDLLGHSSVATTQVYLHTDPDRMRAAVERL